MSTIAMAASNTLALSSYGGKSEDQELLGCKNVQLGEIHKVSEQWIDSIFRVGKLANKKQQKQSGS